MASISMRMFEFCGALRFAPQSQVGNIQTGIEKHYGLVISDFSACAIYVSLCEYVEPTTSFPVCRKLENGVFCYRLDTNDGDLMVACRFVGNVVTILPPSAFDDNYHAVLCMTDVGVDAYEQAYECARELGISLPYQTWVQLHVQLESNQRVGRGDRKHLGYVDINDDMRTVQVNCNGLINAIM